MTCPACGTDSTVTVLHEGDDGTRVLRQFCKECARRQEAEERSRRRQLLASLAAPVTYSGLLLVVLALVADSLSIGGRSGFGWRQVSGAEVGFLCVFLGIMLRQALLGTAGLFLLVLSILADLLVVGHAPGAGWRARVAIAAGTALLAAGLYMRRALTRLPPAPPRSEAGR